FIACRPVAARAYPPPLHDALPILRVPARDRQRITQALLTMEQEPLSGDVIPLKGPYEGSYRRRVGSWRIIFALKWDTQIVFVAEDRKSTRLNSSHVKISYAVFCLK